MRRPHWRSAIFAAASGALSLTMLAGCATRQFGISAKDESARYLQNARGRYTVPGPAGDPWGPYIHEASRRFDMPEPWIRALMRQESGGSLYRGGRLITSSAGAMGLMQVMPGTYMELRARHNLGPDPYDPHDNIMAGVGYMREMYDMYGSPGFLAAYNAGPNRLDDYLANQRALPDETRHYVAVIGPALRTAAPHARSPAEQYAMNQLPLYIPPGPRYGYGAVQVPTVQVASATTTYKPPVFTQTAYQPTYTPPAYTPAPQQRVLAFAQPPRPVYTPAPAPAPAAQPRVVAWNEPPKPVYVAPPVQTYTPPVRAYSPPPQRTVVARVERDEEAPAPRTRYVAPTRVSSPSRVALAMPGNPPVRRSGGGLHLISAAVAAEVYRPTRNGRRPYALPVSYKVEHVHSRPATTWKLHASGPVQAAPVCRKNTRGKLVCGPARL
jgi:hypothetical protein